MSTHKKFVNDNVVTATAQVLISVKGLLIIPIVTKTVGTTVFGGYSLVVSALALLVGISSLGAYVRCRRYLPAAVSMDERAALYFPQLGFHLIFSLVLVLVLLTVAGPLLGTPNDMDINLGLLPIYLFFYILFFQLTDYFRYTDRIASFNALSLSLPYLFISFVLLGFVLGYEVSINLLLALEILAMLVIVVLPSFTMFRELGLRVKFYKFTELVADVRLGFPVASAFIVDFVLAASDRYFIAYFITVTAVGQYVPAYALGSLIVVFAKVAGVVLPPVLSKAVDQGRDGEAQTLLNYSLKGYLLLAIPFVVGSFVLSEHLLIWIANEEVADAAKYVTPLVALASLFYGLCQFLHHVLFVRLHTIALFRASSSAAIVNILLNLVLFQFFDNILVAAVTTLISYIVMFLYLNKVASPLWSYKFDAPVLIKSFVASLLMGGVLLVLNHLPIGVVSWWWVIIEVIVGIMSYAIFLLCFGVLSTKEREFIRGYI